MNDTDTYIRLTLLKLAFLCALLGLFALIIGKLTGT